MTAKSRERFLQVNKIPLIKGAASLKSKLGFLLEAIAGL